MTVIQQLKEVFIYVPASFLQLKRNSIKWLAIYFFSGLVVFSLFTWLMLSNQQLIKNVLLSYLFPQSWHAISEMLASFFFESQAKAVLGNMILSGSLVVASIFLFPVKEKYSAAFERDGNFQNGPPEEFPLISQAWDETKLFLLYLTAQSAILWIGYYPYTWATWLSILLSYLFLFFTFGLDFISPTLQRHRIEYILILKVLFKKPVLVFSFGLLFSFPVIILSRYVFAIEDLTLIEIASILFLANIIFLTLAVPAGTRVASNLLRDARRTLPPGRQTLVYAYSIVSIIMVGSLFLHGMLISSMHHKSQLLKAEYRVDWSSIEFDLPSLSKFIDGESTSNLSFDIIVKNPTEFDIAIENSSLYIEQGKNSIATIKLKGFEIPASSSRKIEIRMESTSDMSRISNFQDILKGWRIDMHMKLLPGISFILNLVE
jgi:hypothetical protein